MTIVHSEAPWGHSQEEGLAPKERTHPMRPLSCNNNTTTRLKRGPNPLSGVLILILIFLLLLFFFVFFILYFFGIFFFFCIIYFCIFLFCFLYLFFCFLFFIYLFIYFVFCIFFFFISALICCPPGDNHNRPSSPQATERS